ncbi:MAG TPA: hypothetical protein VJR70_02785 [Stellaceae bacterium]|nr:hypothetical protein [Stellaceae bacterium]
MAGSRHRGARAAMRVTFSGMDAAAGFLTDRRFGAAANHRRTRAQRGAETSVTEGGASPSAVASTWRASASSIQCNGIGLRMAGCAPSREC